jgi:hypothetical protein
VNAARTHLAGSQWGGVLLPVVVAPLWREVVTAAGGRCECAGVCGSRHSRTDGRCPAGTGVPAVRLYAVAAPADPRGPLFAWCGPCWDGARRRHDRQTQTSQTHTQTGQDISAGVQVGAQLDALAYLAGMEATS